MDCDSTNTTCYYYANSSEAGSDCSRLKLDGHHAGPMGEYRQIDKHDLRVPSAILAEVGTDRRPLFISYNLVNPLPVEYFVYPTASGETWDIASSSHVYMQAPRYRLQDSALHPAEVVKNNDGTGFWSNTPSLKIDCMPMEQMLLPTRCNQNAQFCACNRLGNDTSTVCEVTYEQTY